MERVGVYPGTFDPPTLGHVDVIRGGARLVDRLVVGVGVNPGKTPLFDLEQRLAMLGELAESLAGEAGLGRIEVRPFSGLVVHFARDHGATVLVRGLRSSTDFDYEFQMAGMNGTMAPAVETVFLMASPAHQAIASSLVRDIARMGGDYRPFVTANVAKRLAERVG